MELFEKIYKDVEDAVISILGIGCDDWRKCKCEDCVLIRKMIVKTLQKIGFNRSQINQYSGISKTTIGVYLSDYSDSLILSRIRAEIKRCLSEKGISYN